MFVDVVYIYGSGPPSNRGWTLRVIDTDFEDTIVVHMAATADAADYATPLIELYARRKLPIAANLARYVVSQIKKGEAYPGSVLKEHIKHVPAFAKYKDEIEKYLLLL